MGQTDRFEELAAGVGGFYRSWVIYLGLELGLFARIRSAGRDGMTAPDLASTAACRPEPIDAWVRAAHAGDLIELVDGRATVPDDVASILLDDTHPEYLGGQFVVAVVSSLDYAGLADFVRSGTTIAERPPRFHRAIEAVTVQDIAVFFQEGLAELPDLAAALVRGGRVLDVACGGGKLADRDCPALPRDRARRGRVRARFGRAGAGSTSARRGLDSRIRIEARSTDDMPFRNEFDLVYLQDALHELPDPIASLRAAWAAVAPGGRLVVLEWCLPARSRASPSRSRPSCSGGSRSTSCTRARRCTPTTGIEALFAEAAAPAPTVVDLLSGASLFVAAKPG